MASDIKSYRDLKVWQLAMDLAEAAYRLTQAFPNSELYGLTSQIRRAAASIPANMAEGHGRETTNSFVSFLRISQGSIKELETHLLLSERVGLVDAKSVEPLLTQCDTLGKMLRAFIRSLQRTGKDL